MTLHILRDKQDTQDVQVGVHHKYFKPLKFNLNLFILVYGPKIVSQQMI